MHGHFVKKHLVLTGVFNHIRQITKGKSCLNLKENEPKAIKSLVG